MNQQHFLVNEVARLIGVKAHQIQYAIASGFLPEPAERINNKRIFTPKDIAQIGAYFTEKRKRRARHEQNN